jgi:hypothetical protein
MNPYRVLGEPSPPLCPYLLSEVSSLFVMECEEVRFVSDVFLCRGAIVAGHTFTAPTFVHRGTILKVKR